MSSPSLLLVEPCKDLAGTLHSRIQSYGFHVTVAPSAAEVKQVIQESTFDVTLLDHDFLASDSLGLCAWLTIRKGAPCVILLSNVVDSMLRLRAAACGVYACVAKQDWRHDLPFQLERASEKSNWQLCWPESLQHPHIRLKALVTP